MATPLIDMTEGVVRDKSVVSRFSVRALRCSYKQFDNFVFLCVFFKGFTEYKSFFSFFTTFVFLGKAPSKSNAQRIMMMLFDDNQGMPKAGNIFFKKNQFC